jgi:hypothetical protein
VNLVARQTTRGDALAKERDEIRTCPEKLLRLLGRWALRDQQRRHGRGRDKNKRCGEPGAQLHEHHERD